MGSSHQIPVELSCAPDPAAVTGARMGARLDYAAMGSGFLSHTRTARDRRLSFPNRPRNTLARVVQAARAYVNCRKLRNAFEGREAVYIEKGIIRVRVSNIQWRLAAQTIHAQVEEVPTPGLEDTMLLLRGAQVPRPLQWSIGAGYETDFSRASWHMGYGGWSLFFAPEVVEGLKRIAAGWPSELEAPERYREALKYVEEAGAYVKCQRVFGSADF